jgi:hypothetical protein
VETGARSRLGGGVSVMPRPFLVLEALYRETNIQSGTVLSGNDSWESVFQLHLLY